ncbi:MAG: biofilm-associated protein [Nitrosopumilus sp.]|uniref:biofilm-associated protein n=1 Tax=Nitrosopumilus sp. TaxID=2024843 RepID=UPI00246B5CB0|nr:biofilm-associated protein [Nitrosopumilus sp.]MDH5430674.1 biofilm-associated protein [Nitrosopumilus sp.]MDH5697130.1 biofilm-associated protein [Nitrosopumilus sp.]
MNRSSTRGIFLAIALLLSTVLMILPSDIYAEEITVTSIALDETSVMELTNDSDKEVNTLRIWLGSDFNFKSFKTEKGWVGEKNAQGVIIFTSSESIKPGESVKFGIKTDKPITGINWKVLDKKNTQIDTGITSPGEIKKVVKNPKPNQNSGTVGQGILLKSEFRIVPEKPNVDSTIRVTGDNFGSSQEFDFYIDSKKLGTFVTDEEGHFITTMKIPKEQKADRVDFIIKDKEGQEKKLSLRIGENINRIPDDVNTPLTVKGIPKIVHRGDFLEIFGTASPGSGVSIEIMGPDNNIIRTRTAETDSKGNWKLDSLLVPLDRPFGKYIGTISDGRNTITGEWEIKSDKVIIITPNNLKYEPGETMKFNGTALPNKSIEIVLEDPLGKEIVSDIVKVDETGFVKFEFPTTQSTPEGTYTLIATQEKEKEFTYAGLGQLPTIPVNLEFDKLSYKIGETAVITLSGKASEVVNLLIIDPSDKPKGKSTSITLQPDGRGTHTLKLDGYSSGVYTAVISKGTAQSSEVFTVGLQTGSGEIKINTTKLDYHPGDSILVLGETGSNVLLTVTLINPEGEEVKIKETFSDKNGKISEGSFRVPTDAKRGEWIINAKSGSNFDNAVINVVREKSEGMTIEVGIGQEIPGYGKTINIHVFGASQTVELDIIAEDGEIIDELSFPASKEGEINQPWIIPKDTEPGTYTIKVSDAHSNAETTFKIE